jgi:2-dehydro-3-deoxygluconokinase
LARIVVIGEGMLELSRKGEGWQLGYGGDTLNTAIHLARAGHDVAYLTALGIDPMSANLKARWAAEGLDTSLVLDHPSRSTGLYAISTDAAGERSFAYWRDSSAARQMDRGVERVAAMTQPPKTTFGPRQFDHPFTDDDDLHSTYLLPYPATPT